MTKQSQKNPSPQQNQKDQLNTYAKYSGIGLQMFAIIGAGSYAGVKLDEYFVIENHLFAITLSLIAVIISMVYVIKRIIAGSNKN